MIAVAEAADDCTVVVVAGVFHGNIFDFGGGGRTMRRRRAFPISLFIENRVPRAALLK